jgi:acetyltransferase-like isoleucine patch superfamily enzyme
MAKVKKILTLIICILAPVRLSFWILNLLGHEISRSAKIGFSFIWVEKLELGSKSRIGHLNLLLNLKQVRIFEKGYIGYGNVIKGPFSILLKERAAIGNRNVILRSKGGVSYGEAVLQIGVLSKITAGHKVDCMRSVKLGDYTTFAGSDTQIWTHGYVHEREGSGRFRIDGEIIIGNNVYIGSRCVFNPGVRIADGVTIGSNATVSKSLLEAGLYVSQPLRRVDYDPDEIRNRLTKVEENVIEVVYEKKV